MGFKFSFVTKMQRSKLEGKAYKWFERRKEEAAVYEYEENRQVWTYKKVNS